MDRPMGVVRPATNIDFDSAVCPAGSYDSASRSS
jgi:hypothetical protein